MDKFKPVQIQKKAKAWIKIYEIIINEGEGEPKNEIKGAAIVCFFFGLELYLKGLLIVLNPKFEDGDKLKKLGHNFNLIFRELVKVVDKMFAEKIKEKLKSLNLFNIDVVELRYPPDGTMTKYSFGLYNGDHGFDNLFKEIDNKIRKKVLENKK